MTSLGRVDENPSPAKFNENIFSQSTHGALSPLKMHAVHIGERSDSERGDMSLIPSPSPLPTSSATPFSQSSLNELEPPHINRSMKVSNERASQDRMQQKLPAIPPKSPLRGAKESKWLSRLLSRTVGRLSCFTGDGHEKTMSKRNTEQYKRHQVIAKSTSCTDSSVGGGYANPGFTNHVITIPFVGGSPDCGG